MPQLAAVLAKVCSANRDMLDLFFHFLIIIAASLVVSMAVLRRYSAGVRDGMQSTGQFDLLVPPSARMRETTPLDGVGVDDPSPIPRSTLATQGREAAARRRIAIAYLLATAVCGQAISFVTLWVYGTEITLIRLMALTGAVMGAAVPMIAVSVAWPFWRALLVWLAFEVVIALFMVVVPIAIRLQRGAEIDPTLAMNAVYFFQWIAVTLTLPFALAFATGVRKLRGVAPVSLALISVLGFVPLFGAEAAGTFGVSIAMYASFFLLAPAAAWVAWRIVKALSLAYEAKRFSDAQLLANMWWLIFVATLVAPLTVQWRGPTWVLLFAAGASFAMFPIVVGVVLRCLRGHDREPGPALLLLRLFGHTGRSEQFFDRVVGRWRMTGPVLTIAAPDIVARTFDPADFLRFTTGRSGEAFVESQRQLDHRLSELDKQADPDGRYRVSKFCCRANSWQATVIALMNHSDAIVVDVRGLTANRDGVRFELEQLAERVQPDRIVLVIDKKTDLGVLQRSFAMTTGGVRLVRIERNSASETQRVFAALMEAAQSGVANAKTQQIW